MTEPSSKNKDQNRQSLLFHLELLQNFGVQHLLSYSNFIEPTMPIKNPNQETPVNITTPEANLSTVQTLADLKNFIGDCQRCKLCTTRTNIVFDDGSPVTELMFVGEGPGRDEDLQGIPFVGRAGQLLTKMIEAMGYKREEIYIANVVKCRPPENRNPEEDEMKECLPFLEKQIQLVNPKIIICLGKFATQSVLNTQIPISKLRGEFQDRQGIAVMPTYHPAFLLRNPTMKKVVWEDLKKVMKKLGKA